MTLSRNGKLAWTPAPEQTGRFDVVLASRRFLRETRVRLTLEVARANHPPTLIAFEPTAATEGRPFSAAVRVADAEGDAIRAELINPPTGMTLTRAGADFRIEWQPGFDDRGSRTVRISLSDATGSRAVETAVRVAPVNHPPQIVSTPPTAAVRGTPFTYAPATTDRDGGALTYSLTRAPEGMRIDKSTGRIEWTPDAAAQLVSDVVVSVADAEGATDTQSFRVALQRLSRIAVIDEPIHYAESLGDGRMLAITPSRLMIIAESHIAKIEASFFTPSRATRTFIRQRGFVYLTQGADGIDIFDLRQRGEIQRVGRIDAPQSATIPAFAISDGRLVAVDISRALLTVYSLEDPARPEALGSHAFGKPGTGAPVVGVTPFAVRLDGETAYVQGKGFLAAVNISRPRATKELSRVAIAPEGPPSQWGAFVLAPPYGYLAGPWLNVFDLRDPSAIVRLGSTRSSTYGTQAVVRADKTLVMFGAGSVSAYSLERPTALMLTGYHDLAAARHIIVTPERDYRVTEAGALEPIDIDAPQPERRAASYDRIRIRDGKAYITGLTGLRIFDIADAARPRLLGEVNESYFRGPIILSGNLLLTAGAIADISNPAAPTRLTRLRGEGPVAISGSRVFVPVDRQLEVWDISTPTTPWLVRATTMEIRCVAAGADGTLYAGLKNGVIQSYRVDPEGELDLIGELAAGKSMTEMELDGAMLYVAMGPDGVAAVDVSDAAKLKIHARFDTEQSADSVHAINGRLAVGDGQGGMVILDLRDAAAPRALAMLPTTDAVRGIDAAGNTMFVCNARHGLHAFATDLFTSTPPVTVAVSPVPTTPVEPLILTALPPDERRPELDCYGDPLPQGAALRWGSTRFRHSGPITALAYSPDGRWIASGSTDLTIRIWDTTTGRAIHTLQGHTGVLDRSGFIGALAFSPDGRKLVSHGYDETIRLWDVETGQSLKVWRDDVRRQRGPNESCGVAFSPDGALVLADRDSQIVLRSVETGKETTVIQSVSYRPHALAFLPDGQSFVSMAPSANQLFLWDAHTGRMRISMRSNEPLAQGFALSPDGGTIAAAATERILLFETVAGRICGAIEGHTGTVMALAFSPDGRRLASMGRDRTLRVWDVASRKELYSLPIVAPTRGFGSVAFSPDGRIVASGDDGGAVRMWDSGSGAPINGALATSGGSRCIAFAADGRSAFVGQGDGVIARYDAATGEELARFNRHAGAVNGLAILPDGAMLSAGEDRNWRIWDPATGDVRATGTTAPNGIGALAVSPDGQAFATGLGMAPDPWESHIRTWDVVTGGELRRMPWRKQAFVASLAYSPDGKSLIAGGGYFEIDGLEALTAALIDPATGERRRSWRTQATHAMAISPDGKLLVTGGDRGRALSLLNAKEDRPRPFGPEEAVRAVAFGPGVKWIASGTESGALSLWDMAEKQERLRLELKEGAVRALALSPDGQWLAAAFANGTSLVWSVAELEKKMLPPQKPKENPSGDEF